MINAIKRFFLNIYIKRIAFPKFNEGNIKRYFIDYSGKVQKVGFRDQIRILAEILKITGYIRNISNNRVITEIQGPQEKLDFLVRVINEEKRFRLDEVKLEEIIPVQENRFVIIKI